MAHLIGTTEIELKANYFHKQQHFLFLDSYSCQLSAQELFSLLYSGLHQQLRDISVAACVLLCMQKISMSIN